MKHNTAGFALPQKAEPFVFDVDSLFYHLDCLTDRRKPKGVRYPLASAPLNLIVKFADSTRRAKSICVIPPEHNRDGLLRKCALAAVIDKAGRTGTIFTHAK